MMNSKGFLVRSAKGLNDCTGGYNNFTDLKGFFQLVKQILVDQTIYFPLASTFHDKFLLPVFFNSFEEQILLSLRSGTGLLTF